MREKAKFGCRRDENHKEIVAYLEELGYVVLDLSPMGKGVPDVVISTSIRREPIPTKAARMWLAEIKDGDDKDFTEAQLEFFNNWAGKPVVFLRNRADVDFFHMIEGEG